MDITCLHQKKSPSLAFFKLPDDEEGLTEWCQQRWKEKEEMLRCYYNDLTDEKNEIVQQKCANRRFPNDKVPPLSDRGILLWFCIAGKIHLFLFFCNSV